MREIKFRAWDSFTKKMITTGFHIFGEITMFQCIEQYCYENPKKNISHIIRLNDIKIMQYTGLKDRNNKNIYEGDILSNNKQKAESEKPSPHYFYIVQFNKEANYVCETYNGKLKIYPNLSRYNQQSEIIGNIYENPELIK